VAILARTDLVVTFLGKSQKPKAELLLFVQQGTELSCDFGLAGSQ
jgi:hypothetical protein